MRGFTSFVETLPVFLLKKYLIKIIHDFNKSESNRKSFASSIIRIVIHSERNHSKQPTFDHQFDHIETFSDFYSILLPVEIQNRSLLLSGRTAKRKENSLRGRDDISLFVLSPFPSYLTAYVVGEHSFSRHFLSSKRTQPEPRLSLPSYRIQM